MSGVWTERDPSKDKTQIGDKKALSLRTIHFMIWKIFDILQVQIRRLKQRIRMPYIPPLLLGGFGIFECKNPNPLLSSFI